MPARSETKPEPRGRRRSAPNADDPAEELTLDEAFRFLRNGRRRTMLRHLRTTPETTLSDLADHVAAEEMGVPPDRVDSKARKRVYVSLYQSHLPALADAGVIAYDGKGGPVRRLPAADQLDRHLDRLDSGTDAAGVVRKYGRPAAIGGGTAVVVGAVGLSPFDVLGPAAWAALGGALLCALTAAAIDRTEPDE